MVLSKHSVHFIRRIRGWTMGYAVILFAIAVLLGGSFFSKNFTFSARNNDIFPSIYRLSEIKTDAVSVPDIIQRVNSNYQTLTWNYSDDDFLIGMFLPVTYPIHAYEAKLDGTTSVHVEFCKAGQADTKKIIGNKISGEPVWPQYADTYVFKLKRHGSIVESWAYKELGAEASKKYAVVGEDNLPIIKSLYNKVRELNLNLSKNKI